MCIQVGVSREFWEKQANSEYSCPSPLKIPPKMTRSTRYLSYNVKKSKNVENKMEENDLVQNVDKVTKSNLRIILKSYAYLQTMRKKHL